MRLELQSLRIVETRDNSWSLDHLLVRKSLKKLWDTDLRGKSIGPAAGHSEVERPVF